MLTKVIFGAAASLRAPRGWDTVKDGECAPLPIRIHGERGRGNCYCESAWEPTPRELEHLNAGGQIVLRVHGWQVPVMLYVEAPPTEYEDERTCEGAA